MSSSLVLADKVPQTLKEKLKSDYQLYEYSRLSADEIRRLAAEVR